MPKITFLGAGSTIFAKNLLGDLLSFPEFTEATISLHDIDPAACQTDLRDATGRIALSQDAFGSGGNRYAGTGRS